MAELVNVTVTAPDAGWLKEMTQSLIQSELVAAGNLTTAVTSLYKWEDAVHERQETTVSLRTQRRHVASIVEAVTAEHPYEVPHVVATPIVETLDDYRRWVISVTGGPGEEIDES